MSAHVIRLLNDAFRQSLSGGRVYVTRGIQQLGPVAMMEIMHTVTTYDAFDTGNDPYQEHDFGSFSHDGNRILFKIDYYDPDMTSGSDDPADPAKTVRVMTVMLAEEY
jgi:hypothetical protein